MNTQFKEVERTRYDERFDSQRKFDESYDNETVYNVAFVLANMIPNKEGRLKEMSALKGEQKKARSLKWPSMNVEKVSVNSFLIAGLPERLKLLLSNINLSKAGVGNLQSLL